MNAPTSKITPHQSWRKLAPFDRWVACKGTADERACLLSFWADFRASKDTDGRMFVAQAFDVVSGERSLIPEMEEQLAFWAAQEAYDEAARGWEVRTARDVDASSTLWDEAAWIGTEAARLGSLMGARS